MAWRAFFRAAPSRAGEGEPAVDPAVPVDPQDQPARGPGVPLFLLQEGGVVGVGGVGVDDLQQPPPSRLMSLAS